jgi:hypothetical protein
VNSSFGEVMKVVAMKYPFLKMKLPLQAKGQLCRMHGCPLIFQKYCRN